MDCNQCGGEVDVRGAGWSHIDLMVYRCRADARPYVYPERYEMAWCEGCTEANLRKAGI